MRAPDPVAVEHPDLGLLRIRPYGQGRWLIDLPGPDAVSRLHAAAREGRPRWRARPGWSSLLVEAGEGAEPLARDLATLNAPPLPDRAQSPETEAANAAIVIDVVYDGPDLEAVADLCGLSPDDVVLRHTRARYRVVFLGFTRGFAYLDGLDPRLCGVPRLATPRVRVPSGSVGIAAGQTGIYPMDSPGGWHLIGRTTTALFDADRMPPSLVSPGDSVRFRAVQP